MTYATQQDIETLYSIDALYVADRDGDGTVDEIAVTRALGAASDEIDSYLAVRYSVPFPETTGLLKQFCVDIALYRLALGRDVLSDEHRTRYEDAVKHLEKIGKGTATLVLPADPDAPTEDSAFSDRPKPVVAVGPERLFTRKNMRGL